jgi:hypothetical protein
VSEPTDDEEERAEEHVHAEALVLRLAAADERRKEEAGARNAVAIQNIAVWMCHVRSTA